MGVRCGGIGRGEIIVVVYYFEHFCVKINVELLETTLESYVSPCSGPFCEIGAHLTRLHWITKVRDVCTIEANACSCTTATCVQYINVGHCALVVVVSFSFVFLSRQFTRPVSEEVIAAAK